MFKALDSTKWEHPSDYGGYSPDGEYCIYSVNRDSSILERSNWESFKAVLNKLDPEGEYHYDWRAGHWACGWVEYLMLKPDAPDNIKGKCDSILCALSDYPVLDESHYYELQLDEILNYWESMSVKERVEYCKDGGDCIFSARHSSPPEGAYNLLSDSFY